MKFFCAYIYSMKISLNFEQVFNKCVVEWCYFKFMSVQILQGRLNMYFNLNLIKSVEKSLNLEFLSTQKY